MDGRYSFFATNWSNYELNIKYNTIMEGCLLLNTSCGSAFARPVKDFTNIFLRIPYVTNYIGHNNIIFHS